MTLPSASAPPAMKEIVDARAASRASSTGRSQTS
jgi:hypothetical protein